MALKVSRGVYGVGGATIVADGASSAVGASDEVARWASTFAMTLPREILGLRDRDGVLVWLSCVALDGDNTPVIGFIFTPSPSFLLPFSLSISLLVPCVLNGNGVVKIDFNFGFVCAFGATFVFAASASFAASPPFAPNAIPRPALLGIFVGDAIAFAFFSLIFANELAVGANNLLPIDDDVRMLATVLVLLARELTVEVALRGPLRGPLPSPIEVVCDDVDEVRVGPARAPVLVGGAGGGPIARRFERKRAIPLVREDAVPFPVVWPPIEAFGTLRPDVLDPTVAVVAAMCVFAAEALVGFSKVLSFLSRTCP